MATPNAEKVTDPLVVFLYLLMQQGLPVGDVEELLEEATDEYLFLNNHHLLRMAEEMVSRLRSGEDGE